VGSFNDNKSVQSITSTRTKEESLSARQAWNSMLNKYNETSKKLKNVTEKLNSVEEKYKKSEEKNMNSKQEINALEEIVQSSENLASLNEDSNESLVKKVMELEEETKNLKQAERAAKNMSSLNEDRDESLIKKVMELEEETKNLKQAERVLLREMSTKSIKGHAYEVRSDLVPTLRDTIKQMDEQLKMREGMHTIAKERILELRETTKKVPELEEKIVRLEETLKERELHYIEDTIPSYEAQLAESRKNIVAMEGDTLKTNSTITMLETKNTKLEFQLANLEENYTLHVIPEYESNVLELKQKLTTIEDARDKLTEKNKTLEKESEGLSNKANAVERHYASEVVPSMREQIQDLKDKVFFKDTELTQATSNIEILEKQASSLNEKFETMHQRYTKDLVPALEKNLLRVNEKLMAKEDECLATSRELESFRREKSEMEEELSDRDKEIALVCAKLEETKARASAEESERVLARQATERVEKEHEITKEEMARVRGLLETKLHEAQEELEEASRNTEELEKRAEIIPGLEAKVQELMEANRIHEEKFVQSLEKVTVLQEEASFVPGLRETIVDLSEKSTTLIEKHSNAMDKIEELATKTEKLNTRCDEASEKQVAALDKVAAVEQKKQEAAESYKQKISALFEQINTMEEAQGRANKEASEGIVRLEQEVTCARGEIKALESSSKERMQALEEENSLKLVSEQEKFLLLEEQHAMLAEEKITQESQALSDIEALEEKILSLEEENQAICNSAMEKITALQKKFNGMEQDNETITNTANEQIKGMKKQIAKVEEERDVARGTAFSNTETFEKKITVLEEQISTLNDANADMHLLREKVDELSDELCSKVDEISSLEEEIAALKEVNKQKNILDLRVKEQHLILSTMKDKNDDLFTTNERILVELKTCGDEVESHSMKILQLQEENSAYEEKVTRGEEKMSSVLANLQTIKEANSTTEGCVAEATAHCESLNEENNKLCKQIAIMEEEAEEKSNRIGELEKEEDSLITKINALEDEVDGSKDTVDALQKYKEECKQLEYQLDSVKKERRWLTEEYEGLMKGMQDKDGKKNYEKFQSLRRERDEARAKSSLLQEQNKEIAVFKSSVEQLRAAMIVLQKEHDMTKRENDNLQFTRVRLEEMEEELKSCNDEEGTPKEQARRIFRLEMECQDLRVKLNEKEDELSMAIENLNAIRRANDSLRGTLERLTANHIEVSKSGEEWKRKFEAFKTEANQLSGLNAQLEEGKADYEHRIKEQNEMLLKAKNSLEKVTLTVKRQKEDISSYKQARQKMMQAFFDQEAKVENSVQEELTSMANQSEELSHDVDETMKKPVSTCSSDSVSVSD